MSRLIDLIDNTKTDKNTCHSYIQTYEELFSEKKFCNNNVLEIGIGEPKENKENGGSIKLWHDYFINSTIYGLDIHDISNINESIINKERIKLFTSVDAYDIDFIEKNFKELTFDIMIDDGPHTLESMLFFIKNYLPLLNKNGILVIEDIPDIEWLTILYNSTPDEFKSNVHKYDLRSNKNRWDDILFVIKK
jgi:hypothetical protein